MKPPATYRQSLLAAFETCPRRTWYDLKLWPDDLTVGYMESSADLGSLLHEVYAELLRTLYRQGEEQISTQEAVEVMYEVDAKSDIVLPADEREDLKMLTLRFCEYRFDPRRIISIEQGLQTIVKGQDGIERTLTGHPDVLMADPPKGLIVIDYKTGWGVPRTPRKAPEEGEIVGKQYLSARGHVQLDVYGLLALRNYPTAEYVTLRELHLRSGEKREATLHRDELEHVEREVGVQMQKLERGITEGITSKVWKPRPGKHCLRSCPVAMSCPVPQEQRGDGSLATHEDADAAAARFVVVDAVRQQLRDQLKAAYEADGYAPKVGDGREVRWKDKPEGGRTFGVHEIEEAA